MKNDSADVVVIGGGAIGTATAYYLAKAGVKVMLLERSDISSGSSGACDKAVSMQSKNPGYTLELALKSRQMYENLGEELECDLEFKKCGGMIAIENERQLEVMKAFVKRQQDIGLQVELLSGAEARYRQPAFSPTLIAATYSPMDARVSPLKVTFGFAKAAKRLGAVIKTGSEVVGIKVVRGKVEGVRTQDGYIKTDRLVNAAGVWAPFIGSMAGINVPIKPRRGQLIVTESMPGYISGEIWSARYIVAKHNPELIKKEDAIAAELGVGLSVSQTNDGNLLIGGTREFAGYDTNTTPEALTAIVKHAANILPGLRQTHMIRSFAGLRPFTPDGKPILKMTEVEGFYLAAGHEGDGIALAPVTGKLMAQKILN